MLTSKQRSEFRAQANGLEATLMVGKGGVSDSVIAEAEILLEAKELVKGRVLETALMSAREVSDAICEATGADVYTSLVVNDEFSELVDGIVGVPTTFFVDRNGALVGTPICGADVPGCKATAESLISGM